MKPEVAGDQPGWLDRILDQRRLILAVVTILCVAGAAAWMTMVRQEDPSMPNFWGQIVVPFPGADAEVVEHQVLDPVEEQLAQVPQVNWIKSTAFAELAVVTVELRHDTSNFEDAWEDVRKAVGRAHREFPAGALEPRIDDNLEEQESVVLAVTGSPDPLVLLEGARKLRHELLSIDDVSKVNIVADPGEQVTIAIDDAAMQRLGSTSTVLAYQLANRNEILPGGSLRVADSTVRLRPRTSFSSTEEIADTPVLLPSGNAVPLRTVARVRHGPSEPSTQLMRSNGEMAVGLGVVPRPQVQTVRFGERVRDVVERVEPTLGGLKVHEVAYQPAIVAWRLKDLGRSLLMGVLIVAAVLVLAMGTRLGLVVASVVPLVALASIAVFAMGGGVLHQISIAALVIALGMLVDNAIVVAENVQWQLDRGATRSQAARLAVRELAVPLAGATGTTLAAFVPMLLTNGPTAEFTRSIPVVIMITLAVSYLFALFVTPSLARWVLKPRKNVAASPTERLGGRLAGVAIRHPIAVLAAAGLVVAASTLTAGGIRQQFFPSSDRPQLTVDVRMPEGTHTSATDETARSLERALLAREDVVAVSSFVGRSAPHFYYNLPQVPWSPHFAQLVVEARSSADTDALLDWLRTHAREQMVGVEVVPRKLEQGPPITAPIELRLYGRDPEALHLAATSVVSEIRAIEGTLDVRHDMDPGSPTLDFRIDDAEAGRFNVTRKDVATALYGRTRGLPIGELRGQDDPIPVVVRAEAGEQMSVESLSSVDVSAPGHRPVPLAQIARLEPVWRPAAIRHRDRSRVVTVSAQLSAGATYSDILSTLRPRLDALDLPAGVTMGYGGEEEGSDEARGELFGALPVGLLLLLGVLLAEFNSFRKVGIVLITVPLAVAGVVPGLLLGGQPFGFTAFMGAIALVGVVVNNAIVLLEVIEQRQREGASIEASLRDAVARRIRPILLTTATTVAGLVPLAISSSTLWPPLAFAMISGLIASTGLTLLVVPALVRVMFRDRAVAPEPVAA